MMFTNKFFAVFFALVQVAQAMSGAPKLAPGEPRLGKPCDGAIKVRCNAHQVPGPEYAFKVKCENGVWVKGEVCASDEICQYLPGFDRTICVVD